jgi:hypothetical protein
MLLSYTEIAIGHNGFHIDFTVMISLYKDTSKKSKTLADDENLPYIAVLRLPSSVYIDNDEIVSYSIH